MPAGRDRHEPRPLLARRGMEQVLEQAEIFVATHERRLEHARAAAPADLATTRNARHAGTGDALPLRTCSPAGSNAMALVGRAFLPRPRAHLWGGATDCSLLAVLTRSPATMPSPVAPIVTAASPVKTPARAEIPRDSLTDVDEAQRGAHCRSASFSRATGAPQIAMTASPMNFSIVPPYRLTLLREPYRSSARSAAPAHAGRRGPDARPGGPGRDGHRGLAGPRARRRRAGRAARRS